MGDTFDKYSPLTPHEFAAGPAIALRAPDVSELVLPVPADAPLPPTQHFKHGEPTATWIHRDARGAEVCRILRFDFPDGRKEFCPLSLWRNAKGLRWRWKALCAPRPLYGLDRLADNPDAPVIVCEGEKAADAAAKVFPDHAAVTSSGGSQAATKTDWTPLAGRCVTIWPDNDESGANYARGCGDPDQSGL
jgi:putative DNA primase/helicase